MKNILTHIVNYEKTIFGKNKTKIEKRDMASFNLEKALKYLRIEESLRSENLTEYYLYKEIFLCFSLPRKILYKHKVKQIIELAKTS